MSPPNRLLTIQLVTLVWSSLVFSWALAYTSSPTSASNRPFLLPLDLHEIQAMRRSTATTHFPIKEEGMSTARPRYDLGIGKNPPFVHKNGIDPSSSSSSVEESTFQGDHMNSHQHQHQHQHSNQLSATRYLVEHSAAREYPSPLLVQPLVMAQNPPPRQQRTLPKVQHERRVKDVLHIHHPPHDHSDDVDHAPSTQITPDGVKTMKPTSSKLPLIRASSKVQLDVNTVWVEMMLHSEHMKSVSTVPSAVA